MSERSNKKGTMAKDTLIYMLAKGTEGAVGILTLSIFTRLFLPEEMGIYSTVNVFVTTVAMLCIQWLVQSVLRYVNNYDLENRQEEFYSTVFKAWLNVNLSFLTIGTFVVLIIQAFFSHTGFAQVYTAKVLYLAIIMFITYNTSQLLFSLLAARRFAKTNLVLSVVNITGKLGLIVLLCNVFGKNLQWIFLSYIVFDGISCIVGVYRLKVFKYIKYKSASKEILGTFKVYGLPLVGNMFATSILNKSDIYIITYFLGEAEVGIYQTSHSIVGSAFTMLQTAVMRGSYPTILRTWAEGKKELTESLISDAVRFFLIIAVPAVCGIFALSDVIAISLFDPQYFEGHKIMFWIAFGMMFLGITEYAIKPWELTAQTASIFKRSLLGGIVNIVCNVLFIPIFGTMAAAYSCFIGFFIYFISAKMGTRKYMKWNLQFINYFRIVLSGVIMAVCLLLLKKVVTPNLISLVGFVIGGGIIYFICLYVTGEIKNEGKAIISKIKRQKGQI